MSDVLSADAVLRLDIDFDPDGDWAKAEESWAALARSHEQLRAALDEAGTTLAGMARERDEAEAAARAGGCAADALGELVANLETNSEQGAPDYAHDALSSYDRAASGQTAEKEEA